MVRVFFFTLSVLVFVFSSCRAQEGTLLAEVELYRIRLMKNLKVTEQGEKEEEKALLEKTQSVTNTLSAMEGIYEGYCTILRTFETATGALNTYREVAEFEREVEDILHLYTEYGGGVFLNTFYDADKYLNPELQRWYCLQMKRLSDEVVGLMKNIKLFRGNDIRMKFEDRLTNIRLLCMQIKRVKNQMYQCICIIESLYQINLYRESEFHCRKSCFDYRNYHYGSGHNEKYFQYKWSCVRDYDKRSSDLEKEAYLRELDINLMQSSGVAEMSELYEKYNEIYDEPANLRLESLKSDEERLIDGLDDLVDVDDKINDDEDD